MMRKFDGDYLLTILTNATLVAFGLLCIFGMFYYKAASVRHDWNVIGYQMMMNNLATPLVIMLCLLIVVCVPKRVLPTRWLAPAAVLLLATAAVMAFFLDLWLALVLILFVSLGFQFAVLGLLLTGRRVRFEKLGFWSQLGSILVHAGFILFIADFAMLHETRWHLPTFWASTLGIGVGCLLSFYAPEAWKRIK